jgi:hypothetical protein
MSTVGQATADHDRVHCAAQKFICRSIRFFGYSGVGQPCRHARGRTQITRSGPARAAVLAIGLPLLTAGVCAPAVKDFAAVRNRSAHTTEDAQPRSQTVMTYSEPSPADLESVLEAAPQEFESPIPRCLRLRVDHVVQHQSTVNDPG